MFLLIQYISNRNNGVICFIFQLWLMTTLARYSIRVKAGRIFV